MKKIVKRIAVMILAVVTVLAMSVPAFAATQERKNEKTSGGAELIGNTLVVNANDQQFFIYGKSVMAQFGGLADIIPNNGTGMIDVLFNGNVFKGVEELIIIRQKNKSEKVTLEEGSMIVTGIKTLEQLTTLKNVVAVNPKNLTELKNNMALNDVDLGATKNFIVTKDGISNENGKAVNSKSISGIAEIVTIKEIEEAEKEAKQTPAETPKSVEKKESAPSTTPAPSVTPTPSPTPCAEHQYSDGEHNCVVCIKCGAKNPKACSGNHNWDTNNGQCRTCGCYCYHKFPAGMTGAACEICGYNPSVGPVPSAPPVCPHTLGFEDVGSDEFHECYGCFETFPHDYDAEGRCEICGHTCNHGGATLGECSLCHQTIGACQVDHSTLCPGQTCTCGANGTGDHHYVEAGPHKHVCNICHDDIRDHNYDTNGYCATCDYHCNHDGATTGACEYCGMNLTPPPCTHGSYTFSNETYHKCDNCKAPFAHTWVNGHCNICNSDCPNCDGKGTTDEGGCTTCGKKLCQIDHSTLCPSQTCSCGAQGTGDHDWSDGKCTKCQRNEYEGVNDNFHVWVTYGTNEQHDYYYNTDGNKQCRKCGHVCTHEYGANGDGCCECCWQYIGVPAHDCVTEGHDWQDGDKCVYCEVFKCHVGVVDHVWNNETGHCNKCGDECPTCQGNGATDGCSTCGKVICPNAENHALIHSGERCPNCDYTGNAPHTYKNVDDDYSHQCSGCGSLEMHSYGVSGTCSVCGHVCQHSYGTYESGDCRSCWQNLETPVCKHFDGFTYINETQHQCDGFCREISNHEWENGWCIICRESCHTCFANPYSIDEGKKCPTCGLMGAEFPDD